MRSFLILLALAGLPVCTFADGGPPPPSPPEGPGEAPPTIEAPDTNEEKGDPMPPWSAQPKEEKKEVPFFKIQQVYAIRAEKDRTVFVFSIDAHPSAEVIMAIGDALAKFDVVKREALDEFVQGRLEQETSCRYDGDAGIIIVLIKYKKIEPPAPPPPAEDQPLPEKNIQPVKPLRTDKVA